MTFTVREAAHHYQPKRRWITEEIDLKGELVSSLVGFTFPAPTPMELITMIDQGVPFEEFDDLQTCLDVSKVRLAELLGIAKATLHRREAAHFLHPDESDRLVRFARLLARTVEVVESLDGARRWLKAPQYGLGEAIPLEYARTDVGSREVELLLGRIEHGVYS